MTLPTEDVAALVARVANAINIARYQTPDGLPARELHEEDGRTQEYAMRLARAAVSEFNPLLSTLAGERDEARELVLAGNYEAALKGGSDIYQHVLALAVEKLRAAEARATTAEAQVVAMREALEPFVEAFDCAFSKYVKRYADAQDGARIFNKMPDKWPMESLTFTMGDFRRAREALSRQEGGR